MTDIKVPALGESVTEATVAKWFKSVGEAVKADEPLVELETDKVTLEVPAASAGVLSEILVPSGGNVEVGATLGRITDGVAKPAEAKPAIASSVRVELVETRTGVGSQRDPTRSDFDKLSPNGIGAKPAELPPQPPSVRKLVVEKQLDAAAIPATGKDGRLTKGDVLAHLDAKPSPAPTPALAQAAPAPAPAAKPPAPKPAGREERVRMSRLRRRIAERLKEAQNTAAMLTTFNEADMGAVMAARERYKESFEKKHGVRLGFMSFFVKACIVALKEIPAVNAEIDGEDIVYKHHYDIGVAVGIEQGLVVPVLRDADALGFAGIEQKIAELGRRARDGKLALDDLSGGTFTITNGGVYGSLMSTPILNAPQSGILGMHKIQERPVVVAGKIEARPMMYLALSYDHRIVDGQQAVTFLVRVKEVLEDPSRIVLDL